MVGYRVIDFYDKLALKKDIINKKYYKVIIIFIFGCIDRRLEEMFICCLCVFYFLLDIVIYIREGVCFGNVYILFGRKINLY